MLEVAVVELDGHSRERLAGHIDAVPHASDTGCSAGAMPTTNIQAYAQTNASGAATETRRRRFWSYFHAVGLIAPDPRQLRPLLSPTVGAAGSVSLDRCLDRPS